MGSLAHEFGPTWSLSTGIEHWGVKLIHRLTCEEMLFQCRTVARSAAVLLFRTPRVPVVSISAGFQHKPRSRCFAGGGAAPPPRHSVAGTDDSGGPGRSFRRFKFFAAISLLCCFLKKSLQLERLRPDTTSMSVQANRPLHSNNNQDTDTTESIARLRRLVRDIITEQLFLKKQLRVPRHNASSPFPCHFSAAPPLRRFGSCDDQALHNVVCLSHWLNVRWEGDSRQERTCARHAHSHGSNPTATLHTNAVADLDNDMRLMGHFISSANGFNLLQLQLRKTFYDCLTVLITPIGPRFSDYLSQNNPCEGDDPALIQRASSIQIIQRLIVLVIARIVDVLSQYSPTVCTGFSRGVALRVVQGPASLDVGLYERKRTVQDHAGMASSGSLQPKPLVAIAHATTRFMHRMSAGIVVCGVGTCNAQSHGTGPATFAAREQSTFRSARDLLTLACNGVLSFSCSWRYMVIDHANRNVWMEVPGMSKISGPQSSGTSYFHFCSEAFCMPERRSQHEWRIFSLCMCQL